MLKKLIQLQQLKRKPLKQLKILLELKLKRLKGHKRPLKLKLKRLKGHKRPLKLKPKRLKGQKNSEKNQEQALIMLQGLKMESSKPHYNNGQFNFNLKGSDLSFKDLSGKVIELPDARKNLIAEAKNKIEQTVLNKFLEANKEY